MSRNYILHHGIHDGTFINREICPTEGFDTCQEAIDALAEYKSNYNNIGYVIWFAYIMMPDGSKKPLEGNTDYNR